jgi:diguanylate cyclase (GGDEF)-like protein
MEIKVFYEREESLIEKYQSLLESGRIETAQDKLIFAELLNEYNLLLIQCKKLIKISDRVHGKMTRVMQATSELSNTDFLTNLANRRYFEDILQKEWKSCCRDNIVFSILMLDIDYFKPYNDNYGHQEGDKCLQLIAMLLKKLVNRPRDIIARYGGEEFVILLPSTELEGAQVLAESIRSAIFHVGLPNKGAPGFGVVTVSIGVASMVPDKVSLPEALVGKADEALYMAKRKGRNNVCTG